MSKVSVSKSAASPPECWAPPSPASASHQSVAALPPAPPVADRAPSALQKRAADPRPAGHRSKDRGWRALARRHSWIVPLLILPFAGHVGKFIRQSFAQVLPGAVDVRHGRAFGNFKQFRYLRIFHL